MTCEYRKLSIEDSPYSSMQSLKDLHRVALCIILTGALSLTFCAQPLPRHLLQYFLSVRPRSHGSSGIAHILGTEEKTSSEATVKAIDEIIP